MSNTTLGAYGWRSLLAVGTTLAVLLGLGTWQWQRKHWKEGLLAEITARGQERPLATLPSNCAGCEYRRVRLTGQFVADSERHIFISVPRQVSGIGGPGYWVFAQFQTADGQIYVNRGFIPESQKSTSRAVSGDVTIDGIVRMPEPRGRFSNANDVAKNVYFVRSMDELGGNARRDLYVDLTGPLPPGGLPLPLVGKIAIPNRHLEYALTWYALAVTLACVAFALARRPAG